jgi:hypothetical protein
MSAVSELAATLAAAIGIGVAPAVCDPEATNCATATGTILYVERVDPDGDGDAHFVLAGGHGISVIDVERELRPEQLPGPGDLVSAAGPVYAGSFGQRQIEATTLRVAGVGRAVR